MRLRRWLRSNAGPGTVIGVFVLVGLAWLISNPPGAAPDEDSHYIRMVGMSYGHPIGGDVPLGTPQGTKTGAALARVNAEAGIFTLPGAAPPPNPCNQEQPDHPYDCVPFPTTAEPMKWTSFHGQTLPASYVVPAALSRLAATTNGKLYLGRLGFLLQNTVLFAIAVYAVRPLPGLRRPLHLAALLLACTPLLLYFTGQLAPSGTESVGYVALAACALRALLTTERRWWWTASIIATGLFWVRDMCLLQIPVIVALVLLFNRDAARRLAGALGGRPFAASLAIPFVSAVGALVWRSALQYPLHEADWSRSELDRGVRSLRVLALDGVGRLGWLDVKPHRIVPLLWLTAGAAVLIALIVRDRRWLKVIIAFALAWAALNIWLTVSLAAVAYGNQARFTMALPVVMVLTGALGGSEPRSARADEPALVAVAVLIGMLHLYVFLLNGQRHAHGLHHRLITFGDAVWTPPGGWAFSIVLFVLASASIALLPIAGIARRHASASTPT